MILTPEFKHVVETDIDMVLVRLLFHVITVEPRSIVFQGVGENKR
jgi:hypothetical protein